MTFDTGLVSILFHGVFPLQRNQLTSLYKNNVEDTELRIASYKAMMQCATDEILEEVVETMETENDDQGMLNLYKILSLRFINY